MNLSSPSSSLKISNYLGIRNIKLSDGITKIIKTNSNTYQASVKKFIKLLYYIKNNNIDINSFDKLAELHEFVALHDGAVASMLSIHFNLTIGTIANLNKRTPYIEELYQKLCSGNAIGVYLATELAYGNNLINLKTQATYLPEKGIFILNSPDPNAYKFMPNTVPCELPKIAVVYAQLNVANRKYGIFPFILPLSINGKLTKGVKITPLSDKPGFYLDNAITSFDNVEIPFEGLLAGNVMTLDRNGQISLHVKKLKKRFALVTNRIHTGKICMSICSVGMAKSALYITSTYGSKRQTFGYSGAMPALNYCHFKESIAWDTLTTIAHTLYLRKLTKKISIPLSESTNNFKISDELLVEIISIKSLFTWRTQEILINCRERCGAHGLFSINKIPQYLISNFGAITAEGDNLVLSLKAGEMILTNGLKNSDTNIEDDLLSILTDYAKHLLDKLKKLTGHDNKKITLDIINKNSNDFLTLSQTYAILAVVTTITDSYNTDDIGMILEGYLLDWIHRSMRDLLISEIINIQESKKLNERHITYIRDHAEIINCYIYDFEMDKSGIETPISSDDYIGWYAGNHDQLKN
ncbi:cytochrome-c oxidase [Xenorhabdus koppenhoeferi]|uniref:Acyl-CoA oxidase n=1 Tax=Xenorhabdus koppenhoeferi TaxID=351659 RepID=A0A1I7FJI3_9GAMM|nr:cytochrome-c oxidase [Xenorhabdus koppenhoeferi]SFU36337.1 acyl-CoA oxidase [Xenorhabdus koppenhoeferi]